MVFTLRSDNGWSHSEIGAHFGKSKSWAKYILATYSEESLSPKIVQKRGGKRKTDEVEDGVIVGMAKHLYKESYEKLTVVLNDENICPDIKQNISKWTVFQRCKEAGARSARPIADELIREHKTLRVEWARNKLDILARDPEFFYKVLFSDEFRVDLQRKFESHEF